MSWGWIGWLDSYLGWEEDGKNALSNPATVSITVSAPPSEIPVADDISVSTDQNTSVGIQMTFTDPIGSGPYVFSKLQDVQNGILTAPSDSNDWGYTPNSNFVGTDSFTWTVTDGDGNVSNVATVTIDVFPIGDINGDLIVDLSDVLLIIQLIFDPNTITQVNPDLDSNGNVNLLDIIQLLKIIFEG